MINRVRTIDGLLLGCLWLAGGVGCAGGEHDPHEDAGHPADAGMLAPGLDDWDAGDAAPDSGPASVGEPPHDPRCDATTWTGLGRSLAGCELRGADLRGVDLRGADLSGADLSTADLRGADLSGADLGGALLDGAQLGGTELARAELGSAHAVGLELCPASLPENVSCVHTSGSGWVLAGPGLDLSDADLAGADLSGVSLFGTRAVDLIGCPDALPGAYRCVAMSAEGLFAILGPQVDLSDCDLRGVDLVLTELHDADLRGADLRGAHLHGAGLARTDLRGARLDDADLAVAQLFNADLSGASLRGASLAGADLTSANLRDTELAGVRALWLRGCPSALPSTHRCTLGVEPSRGALLGPQAWLRGVDLSGLDLSGVRLDGADLRGASLSGAKLDGASLAGAHLGNAGLPDASLVAANLRGVSARGVDLAGADLHDADLRGADLEDADLESANMRGTLLEGAELVGAWSFDPPYALETWGCPKSLPDEAVCVLLPASGARAMVGQGVDLRGLDLTGADLSDADLTAAKTTELAGCPARAPDGFACVRQPESDAFALLGPSVDAADADLRDADLSDLDLRGATLTGADLRGAQLEGARLAGASLFGADLRGVELDDESLAGVSALQLRGCPNSLPASWSCIAMPEQGGFAVIGRGARLLGADLRGVDLRGVDLRGAELAYARVTELRGCPEHLPERFLCVEQPTRSRYALLGPDVLVYDADLRGVLMTGVDLEGALFSGSDLRGAIADAANLASVYFSNADLTGMQVEGANLSGAGFYSTDLTNVALGGATLDGATVGELTSCPSTLPASVSCVSMWNGTEWVNTLVGSPLNMRGKVLNGAHLGGVNLASADLEGVRAGDLWLCPTALPPDVQCVAQSGGTLYALVGPRLDLSGLDLSNADLTAVNLQDAYLTDTRLTNARLANARLEGAQLWGTQTGSIRGCPATLPEDYACVQHRDSTALLIGPGADLSDGTLSSVSFSGVHSRELTGCPATPGQVRCVEGHYLVLAGPGLDLRGASLQNSQGLAGVDLHGADLRDAGLDLANLDGTNLGNAKLDGASVLGALTTTRTTCPDGTPGPCDFAD